MNPEIVKRYFEENARSWVLDGYNDDGDNYPVGLHRARICLDTFAALKRPLKTVDLGCGGGNLACSLAQNGHHATGVDQSTAMIAQAEERRKSLPAEARDRARFVCSPLESNPLEASGYDAVTAMGVIGYFDRDEQLIEPAKSLLKPGGLLLVSCRNRLFNLSSVTFRTVNEANGPEFAELVAELDELYQPVPLEASVDFVRRVKKAAESIEEPKRIAESDRLPPSARAGGYTAPMSEPRQHTPRRFKESLSRMGFKHHGYYGIHPHLIAPKLNSLLPPGVFNRLSSALEAYEKEPVSLVWSSVFIGVFEKI